MSIGTKEEVVARWKKKEDDSYLLTWEGGTLSIGSLETVLNLFRIRVEKAKQSLQDGQKVEVRPNETNGSGGQICVLVG